METKQPANKIRPRVHKRTIVFVTLVVFLPWILLSIPKDDVGGAGTTGLSVNHSQHGWPFIQMHSTYYNLWGDWKNGTFVKGKPANVDTKPRAIKSFNNFFHSPERDSKFIEFDLRLTKFEYGEFGYWTDAENWTLWDDEHHFEIRWLGLLANFLLLSIVAVIVGWPIEKRIRSGTLFKYSLFSIGVVVTLLCLGLAFAVGTYREFLDEQSHVQKLEQLEHEDFLSPYIDYTDRFPRVISQLINGGFRPWGDQQVSRMVANVTIDIDVDYIDDENLDRILDVLEQNDYSLSIYMYEYNKRTETYLKKLGEHRIVSLDLGYDAYDWFAERAGEDFYEIPREEALRRAAIAVNLDLKLPHIKDVKIELMEFFTVREQLEPFFDLPPETKVFISGIDDESAKFLLDTADRWPDPTYLEWSEDDVSKELRQKMLLRFPHPQNDDAFGGLGSGGVF